MYTMAHVPLVTDYQKETHGTVWEKARVQLTYELPYLEEKAVQMR